MSPIIRAFVVRRTRQGIQKEYGSLQIDGVERSFPSVVPDVIEYTFSKQHIKKMNSIQSELIDLRYVFSIDPNDLVEKCKNLAHPYGQALDLKASVNSKNVASESPMFYIFQLILMLGFMPYRWMMYKTAFHGKTRDEIRDLKMAPDESKKLLLQLGIFGILRTVFLKRMESSVSALRTSLDNYQRKLIAFEQGVIQQGKIISVSDLNALEASMGDEDLEVSPDLLAEITLDDADPKKYNLEALLADIKIEKEIIQILDKQLEILGADDSKIKEFAKRVDAIREMDPTRKVLVFSYFSDTVKFLEENLFKYSKTANPQNSGFLTSKNRADAEGLASRFSPTSKRYTFKGSESELDVLISTDVLSEGQNLQDAGVLINYDLHWNPVRMIQRNGRVNRLGSVFDEVFVFNMKPESELDSYLKLIQRLQGKIDIIKNTIGTDTPVLDEPENPIEYTDSISEIYSSDSQRRMKALEDAENTADYLMSEDEFVMDLKKFVADPSFTDEYKKQVFGISIGKWGIRPDGGASSHATILALSELSGDANEHAGYQFVELAGDASSLRAMSQLQALDMLRTTSENSIRVTDKFKLDRSSAKKLIETGSLAYADETETGSLIGQQNDILRMLYKLDYSEDEIEVVRHGFKTKDVFYASEMDVLKRRIIQKSKKKENFQDDLVSIVKKATQIANNKRESTSVTATRASLVFAYIDRKLNG
jgi:superfamily II DNA/RNA helicase